jgi:hypothetical protein
MAFEPLRIACIGMGWRPDVLADTIRRSGKLVRAGILSAREGRRVEIAEILANI